MHTQQIHRSARGRHGRSGLLMNMRAIAFIEVHTFGGRGSPF